jgi:hypothetical protein
MYYQFDYIARSSLYVYGIAILVISLIGFLVTTSVNDGNVTISGIGGVVFFHLLIVGISGIREDLKFFLHHGISRRTTYFSHLYGSLICSAALGLFCEIFNLISGHLLGFNSYSNVFTIQGFINSWISYACAFFFAWQIGVLISLIYYRLGKMQQIVFSVTAIATIIFGFSSGIRFLVETADDLDGLIQNLINSFGFFSIGVWVGLLLGILAAVENYFLIRRVQIKD